MDQRNPKLFMSLRFPRLAIAGVAAVFAIGALSAQGATPERVAAGKSLVMERSKGNCLACHRIADGELPGTIGPPLVAMKLRFPERAVLREQICDATIRNPNSRMPPFCRHRILAESDVELIIDYLYTL
jgi:sulfur-oxidizing protein SoxX